MREDFELSLVELAKFDENEGTVLRLEAVDSDEVEPMFHFLREQEALGFIVVLVWGDNSVRFRFTPAGMARWAV